ncbi:hypothetical protein [Pararhodobacter sp. CCB-MM2]|uniref:hypothetical protein n=1 Tax=Pararhodobacter sp. CCB-MM2 TaxID=1786003 RepID=UPI001111975F|nr:hypothetical protein [Pararhodobacter sp. CCB-MM2]
MIDDVRKMGGGGGGGDMPEVIAKLQLDQAVLAERVSNMHDDFGRRFDATDKKLDEISKGIASMAPSLARIETEIKHKIDYKWLALSVFAIIMVMLRYEIVELFNQPPQ